MPAVIANRSFFIWIWRGPPSPFPSNQCLGSIGGGNDLTPAGSLPALDHFSRNICNALACRARAELFETLAHHPQGSEIAVEADCTPQRGSHTTATALVNGRRHRFAVHDPAMAAMLDSIVEKPMPALIRWLAALRVAVSTMITAMPVFIVKNFFRDTLDGFVAGRYAQLPILGTLLGGLDAGHDLVTGRSRRMGDYLLQGGFYSGLVESEVDLTGNRVGHSGAMMAGSVRPWWSRLVYVVTRPAWIGEAGKRVNQFRTARRWPAGGYDAIRAARMVSADFANIGASRGWRMYVVTVPFLNAAIQGLDQLYPIVRFTAAVIGRHRYEGAGGGETHGQDIVLRADSLVNGLGSMGALPSRERPPSGLPEPDGLREGVVGDAVQRLRAVTDIRIPVPFQIGEVFVKLPEVALDLARGTDTQAGLKFPPNRRHGTQTPRAMGYAGRMSTPAD